MNRCDICIEESCNGKYNCNCDNCNRISECYRILHPTIRITTKCTQSCSHCCFECSPEGNKFMTLEVAKNIGIFIRNNNIQSINIMGGEFFLNKCWYNIIKTLGRNTNYIRLVTTGDWVNNKLQCDKLIKLMYTLNGLGTKLRISISKDRWHNNKNVDKAEQFLLQNNFVYNIGETENDKEDVIVPIGRSLGEYNVYGLYGCYCHSNKNMYSFLINEYGTIYKCAFGVWDYANVSEYLGGGFEKRFKEYNKKFYSIFVSSCASCIRQATSSNRTELQH